MDDDWLLEMEWIGVLPMVRVRNAPIASGFLDIHAQELSDFLGTAHPFWV